MDTPSAVRCGPPQQVVVATTEQRCAQRGDESRFVCGVRQRPTGHQQVMDLLRRIDETRCFRTEFDPCRIQTLLQEGQNRARRDEDADVFPCQCRMLVGLVVGSRLSTPALVDSRCDDPGDIARLPCSNRLRRRQRSLIVDGLVVVREYEWFRTPLDVPPRPARHGVQRRVGRLDVTVGDDHPTEHRVDPFDDRPCGAEVGRQLDDVGGRGLVTRGHVGGDVGPAEAVDGLLGVTHCEQPARFVGAGDDTLRQLELQRVGVLELVEQHPLVALVGGRGDGVLAEHVASEDE